MKVPLSIRWRAGLGLLLAGALAACGAPLPSATSLPTPVAITPAPIASPVSPTALSQPTSPSPAATATSAPPDGLALYITEATNLETDPAWKALQALAQERGWQVEAALAADLPALIARGPALVVSASAALSAEALETLTRDHPDTYFIVLGGPPLLGTPANALLLGGPESRQDQAGFLAGLAAGFASETERVAVFADTTTPAGRKYRNGFLSGARYACPKCRLDTVDLAGTEAVDFAAAEAVKYVSLGADVLFAAAGPAGDAALIAAAATGGWVIGSGGDVFVTIFENGAGAGADRVLTSVYLDHAAALAQVLQAYAAGERPAGTQPLTLANGGVSLAPWRNAEAALSPLDLKDVEQARLRLAERALETGVDPLTGDER